jgi:predicted membrane-bound dolichyl-phosphate-mannose-protein mannosyltransferase
MPNVVNVEASGHVYVVGKVGLSAEMKMTRVLAANPGLTTSPDYMALARLCLAVKSIDEKPVPTPSSAADFERIAGQIEDDIAPITKAYAEIHEISLTEKEGVEVAKNS